MSQRKHAFTVFCISETHLTLSTNRTLHLPERELEALKGPVRI